MTMFSKQEIKINSNQPQPTGLKVAKLDSQFLQQSFNDDIGSGSFGNIYKVKWGKQDAALKISSLSQDFNKEIAENEIAILTFLSELPNPSLYIIKLFAYTIENDRSFLLLEYMNSKSLTYFIDHQKKFDDKIIYHLMNHTANAIQFLHSHNIGHLDVNPNNILLNETNTQTYEAKLGDFGGAQKMTTATTFLAGTPAYMPPEFIDKNYISLKWDIYSFSMTLLETFSWAFVFEYSDIEIMRQTRLGIRPAVPSTLSPKIQTMIQTCWHGNYMLRPTAAQLTNAFSTDINTLNDELTQLEHDVVNIKLITNFIFNQLGAINTRHHDQLNHLRDKAKKLLEICKTSDLAEIKKSIREMLEEIMTIFCQKCIGYNQRCYAFFKSRVTPIEYLNNQSNTHRFTRGIGGILKKLISNADDSNWLQMHCQIDLRTRLHSIYNQLNQQHIRITPALEIGKLRI